MTTVPSTGNVGYTDVNNALGRATRNQLGMNDADVRTLTGVATGQIAFPSTYRGKSLAPPASVANYDFRNTSSYSGTGTTVNDLSGNGYTATFNSAPTYSTNPTRVTFVANRVAVSSSVNINLSNGYSIELLFRYTSNPGNFFKIFSYAVGNDNQGLQIQVNSSNQAYMWNTYTNSGVYMTGTLALNTWYHVVFTSTSLVYVNGSSVAKTGTASSIVNLSRPLAIGDQATTRSLAGDVALVRFYNLALSAGNVSSLYTSAKNSGSYGLP